MKDAKHYWNDIWEKAGSRIVYDDWLDRFLGEIDACLAAFGKAINASDS